MILQDRRIFYVEDDTKNRVVVQTILEHAGAVVGVHRWGGGNLITRLEEFAPIDVLLLDLLLPGGKTGYDVFDMIRGRLAFASVPIVAVSALDPADEIPRTQTKGFAGFIAKPIHLVRFPSQIASIISGVHVWE